MKKIIGYAILISLALATMALMLVLIPDWRFHAIFYVFLLLSGLASYLISSKA